MGVAKHLQPAMMILWTNDSLIKRQMSLRALLVSDLGGSCRMVRNAEQASDGVDGGTDRDPDWGQHCWR